jgi:hypothetical protein
MTSPEWYPDWRHAAVHELQAKNKALHAKFSIDEWPRFDYDVDAGTLIFSDTSGPKVRAVIQIAGSTSERAGDWLWAWANAHWPGASVQSSLLAKRFGEEHGIGELAHRSVVDDHSDLNGLGWALTSVVAKLSDGLGGYRPPRAEGGGLYFVYRHIDWVA